MSPLDIAFLTFMVVTLIKIVVMFEAHMRGEE